MQTYEVQVTYTVIENDMEHTHTTFIDVQAHSETQAIAQAELHITTLKPNASDVSGQIRTY